MEKQKFVQLVKTLLDGVKNDFLSPEDFMMRINALYEKN